MVAGIQPSSVCGAARLSRGKHAWSQLYTFNNLPGTSRHQSERRPVPVVGKKRKEILTAECASLHDKCQAETWEVHPKEIPEMAIGYWDLPPDPIPPKCRHFARESRRQEHSSFDWFEGDVYIAQ